MACGCSGKSRSTFRKSSVPEGKPSGRAAQAATEQMHEVLDSRGRSTGRKFSSLVAATGYAKRIGGRTKPV